MTFRCVRKCLFTIPGPEGFPVSVAGVEGQEYESDVDYTEYTGYMVSIDGPAKEEIRKNEFSGVIPAETYERTDLYILRSLAIEKGIKGARSMDARTLARRLNEIENPPN